MNYLDIIILIPLLWGAYKGFSKGLIIELASLIALALGIYCAVHFSNLVSEKLSEWFSLTTRFLPIISFALTFILVVIGVYFLAKLIERVIKIASLSFLNKLMGAVFSTAKYLLIVSVLFILIIKIDSGSNLISEESKNASFLFNPVKKVGEFIMPQIKFPNIENVKKTVQGEKENDLKH